MNDMRTTHDVLCTHPLSLVQLGESMGGLHPSALLFPRYRDISESYTPFGGFGKHISRSRSGFSLGQSP